MELRNVVAKVHEKIASSRKDFLPAIGKNLKTISAKKRDNRRYYLKYRDPPKPSGKMAMASRRQAYRNHYAATGEYDRSLLR